MNHNILFNKRYCCKCLHKKSKKLFNIHNYFYCHNHAILNFNKYIIIIQKYYRAYKSRRYLNIYIKLPLDIQYKIKEKINYNYNTYKLYNTIQKIIINKSELFYNNEMINMDKISHIYTLFYKYFNIIDVSYLKYYFILAKKLQIFNYKILYPENYYFYMDPLYLKINIASISDTSINNCCNILNKFIVYYIHRYYKYCINYN
jgi:hypothetical protein